MPKVREKHYKQMEFQENGFVSNKMEIPKNRKGKLWKVNPTCPEHIKRLVMPFWQFTEAKPRQN